MKKYLSVFAIVSAMAFTASSFVACQSKEESAISQMEKICETVESEDFDSEDWEKIQKEYDELSDKMKDCNFSDEQVQEIAKLQGRFASAAAKQAVGSFGKMLNGAIDAGKGFVEGLTK